MDVTNAAAIRGEYGDMRRFPNAKKAACYAGIVPPTWESGEQKLHGRITKKGSVQLRHALVETANICVRYDSPIKQTYTRLRRRIGMQKAITACARKLATIIWSMIVNEKNYEHQAKDQTELKLWRHRIVNELIERGERAEALRLLRTHNPQRDKRRFAGRAARRGLFS
jgi:hypothetical protein